MTADGSAGKGGAEGMSEDAEVEGTDELDDPEELDDATTDEDDFDDTDTTETATTDDTDATGSEDEDVAGGEVRASGPRAMTAGDRGLPGADDADYEAGDVNVITAPARGPERSRGRDGERAGGDTTSVEVLEYVARAMADEPSAVAVHQEQRRGSTVLRLHVAPQDMGRIIGRRGRTAQAIRTLVGAAGARDGVQTVVDIADD